MCIYCKSMIKAIYIMQKKCMQKCSRRYDDHQASSKTNVLQTQVPSKPVSICNASYITIHTFFIMGANILCFFYQFCIGQQQLQHTQNVFIFQWRHTDVYANIHPFYLSAACMEAIDIIDTDKMACFIVLLAVHMEYFSNYNQNFIWQQ